MSDQLAQHGSLLRRADKSVDTKLLGLLRARLNKLGHAGPISGSLEITVVIGGEHGDREDLQIRAGARFDRRFHGLWIGMHGEESRSEPGNALDAARNRIADVVQLQID